MMLRFEALRRWSGPDGTCKDTGKKLCRLGIVLLKKLLKSTYKHSALSYQEDMTLEEKAKRSKKRSAANEKMETNNEPWKKKRRYLEQTSSAEWTDSSNEDKAQIGYTAPARRPASRRVETLSMLHVVNNKSTSQYDTIPLPVETLAYCLQHVCYYIYTMVSWAFLENGSSENNEILALATLRTLELARLRSYWHPPTVISVEEHQWLEKMEKQIGDSYYMENRKLSSRVKALHRLHMNVLIWDNKNNDHPPAVELIHLLVKCAGSNQKAAMALTISTICHSPSAPGAFTISFKCSSIVDRFVDIFRLFLSRMDKVTTDPIQEKLLLKVLTHYENVVDGIAVFSMIDVLMDYQGTLVLHEATQVAATKLLLHSIKLHKLSNMDDANSFRIPAYCTRMCDVMISLRNTLGAKFFEICHSYFEDLVKLFRSDHSMNFVAAMDTGQFGDDLPEDLVNGLFKFLEAKHPHNLESCDILVALEADGENYKKALQIIKDNSDNFSSTALLQIAQKEHEINPPSEGVFFTNDVDDIIRRALGNIRVQNATAVGFLNNTDVQNAAACGSVDNTCVQNAATLGYNAVFGTSSSPAGLQWVLEAFTVKTSTQSFTQSEQFADISALIVEAFPRDVDTWITLCMKVIASEPLLEVCRDKIGPEIDNIYRRMEFAELRYGNRLYGKLIGKLKSVLNVYNKFVRNGSSAFTNLVKSIKDANRKKKKLLKMLADAFPVDMQS